jgi:hypothetical protein
MEEDTDSTILFHDAALGGNGRADNQSRKVQAVDMMRDNLSTKIKK